MRRALPLAAKLFVAALLLACSKSAPEAGAVGDAAARSVRAQTADGRIAGPILKGWTWAADRRQVDGFPMQELKWQRTTSAGSVLLYAKEYLEARETLDSLERRSWRGTYAATFAKVRTLETKKAVLKNELALEVTVEGDDREGRALSIRELYAPVGTRLLIVTEAGPTEEVRARAAEIAAWRDDLRFAALR